MLEGILYPSAAIPDIPKFQDPTTYLTPELAYFMYMTMFGWPIILCILNFLVRWWATSNFVHNSISPYVNVIFGYYIYMLGMAWMLREGSLDTNIAVIIWHRWGFRGFYSFMFMGTMLLCIFIAVIVVHERFHPTESSPYYTIKEQARRARKAGYRL